MNDVWVVEEARTQPLLSLSSLTLPTDTPLSSIRVGKSNNSRVISLGGKWGMNHFFFYPHVCVLMNREVLSCSCRWYDDPHALCTCVCVWVHARAQALRRCQCDLFGLFVYGAGPFLPSDVRAQAMNRALCVDAHTPRPHDSNAESIWSVCPRERERARMIWWGNIFPTCKCLKRVLFSTFLLRL